jgi:hypothetical protein
MTDWQLLDAPAFGFSVKMCGRPEPLNADASKWLVWFVQKITITDPTVWKSACSGCHCSVICARVSGIVSLLFKPILGFKPLAKICVGSAPHQIHKLLKGYRIDGHQAELWETADSENSSSVCRYLTAAADGHVYTFIAKFKRGAEKDVEEFFNSVHLLSMPK